MVLGTLIYAVVLGFFEDYTEILNTWSYTTTFFAAIVLQLMTYATFQLKGAVRSFFKAKPGRHFKVAMLFFMWLILFLSKFVFIAVLDLVFGESVTVSSFWGILVIIATMTVSKLSIEQVYRYLS